MISRFAIGAVLEFTTALADYPASAGWVLNHRLVLKSGTGAISFSATASGDQHLTSVPAVTTAAWAPGVYTWASWVTKGSDVRDIATGEITLLPNPRTATGSLDLRTPAQVALDNVRALIQGKAGADVLKYAIGGRQLERYSMAELGALEARLAQQVARETRAALLAAGKADPRRYSVRLGRA